ncbi:hypothetical protein [Angelakisella massiliensis]|uniref:hypothetical protein n=1 Tax=Angelakisella massiliensis TaxID=1871018 RepID=UPI0024B1DAC6|nr:hypothetical protein [Angelakisella massiliensis]
MGQAMTDAFPLLPFPVYKAGKRALLPDNLENSKPAAGGEGFFPPAAVQRNDFFTGHRLCRL